jgi:PQQ-like domain
MLQTVAPTLNAISLYSVRNQSEDAWRNGMKIKTISKVFLILLVSLVSSPLFAQTDTFVQKVNGAGDLTAAVQAADGGYVTTTRINDKSFLVRKIKASGQKQWERRLNFDVVNVAFINGIAQTTDGGFVLAGQLERGCFECSNGQPPNGATLVKLRPNGTVAWKSITASGLGYFFASVIPMPDGGVITIGGRLADTVVTGFIKLLLIVRVTATGDVVWKKSFTTLPDSYINYRDPYISSTATTDNGLIIAFPTSGAGGRSAVININSLGNVLWRKSLVGFYFQSVGVTADGGVILVGTGSNQLKVVVLNANGTLSWNAGYPLKVPGSITSVLSPVQTPDGGYVLMGRSGKGFIAKIDSSRNIAFQNTFGASGESVFATPDGGFFLFGQSGLGLLVSKVNSEGIVPGCGFFHPLGTTTNTSFGPLSIVGAKITKSNDSLEPVDFGLTSVVTNHPVSTVCQ